jgi:hypothetical protein
MAFCQVEKYNWLYNFGIAIMNITHEISNTQYLTKITQTKIKTNQQLQKNTFKRNHIGFNTRFFFKTLISEGGFIEIKETLCFFSPILGNEGRQ